MPVYRIFKKLLPRFVFVFTALVFSSAIVYLITLIWLLVAMKSSVVQNADVIVVLGARSFVKPNTYNPCLVGRVATATELYNQNLSSKVIMSGGDDSEDGANEAVTMSTIAQSQGIPSENIILEPNSTSTYENILFSKETMSQKNYKTALIIAEPFHIPRVNLVARKLGLNFTTAPSFTPCWTRWGILSKAYLREPFALFKYRLDGRI